MCRHWALSRSQKKDKHGMQPLLNAIYEGHVEAVKALIAAGADKSGTAPDGEFPPHFGRGGLQRRQCTAFLLSRRAALRLVLPTLRVCPLN